MRNWLAQRGMGKYASLFEANEVRNHSRRPEAYPRADHARAGHTLGRARDAGAAGERCGSEHRLCLASPGMCFQAVPGARLTRPPPVQVDMATLPYLTLQDLRELPILAVGPRRKLLASLERM